MKQYIKPFIGLMSSSIWVPLLTLLITPILTRTCSPHDFGVYGVFIAISSAIAVVSGLRMELAIPMAKYRKRAVFLLALAVASSIPISLGLFGVWILVSLLLNMSQLEMEILIWIPVSAISIVFFQAVNYWFLWNKDYSSAAKSRWVQGVAIVILQLSAGLLGMGGDGLVQAHIISQFAGAFFGLANASYSWNTLFKNEISLKKLRVIFKIYKMYALVMTPAAMLNKLSQNLPILFIGTLFGTHAAGLYAIAQRVFSPLALVGQAIGQIVTAEAPSIMAESREKISLICTQLARNLFIIGAMIIVPVAVAAPYFIGAIFGDEWGQVGELLRIFSVIYLFDFAVVPLALIIGFSGNYWGQLLSDSVKLSSVLLAFVLVKNLDLNFISAMTILSAMQLISYCYLVYLIVVSLGFKNNIK